MDQNTNWYLVQTKPRQEELAAENLTRQHYIVYLPYLAFNKRINKKYQEVTEPMFPRYLFIKLSHTCDDWGPIRSTRGVSDMVRFGGVPAKVPEGLVLLLQQKERAMKNREAPVIDFKIGDHVFISDGVLQGYQGIISETSKKKRVTILLEIMGKATKIDIPVDSIIYSS